MRKNLEKFTDDDLKKELDIRKQEKKLGEKPTPNNVVITDSIKRECVVYIDKMSSGHPEPEKQWIFEAAMVSVYGRGIWTWINNR